MIDFHNHILPKLDDGSESTQMSIDMLEFAASQGIKEVVTTVHYQHPKMDRSNLSFDQARLVMRNLQKEIDRLSIPIKLHLGSEVFFLPNLIDVKDDPLATFGHGKYMLIEFLPFELPEIHRKQLFDLKLSGVVPIIAHPERYKPVQNDLKIIENWLNAGCLIQIDAGSLLGNFGIKAKLCAELIVRNNWCHIIGSDAHNNKKRNFCLKDAINTLERLTDSDHIKKMVNDNPKDIIKGNPIIFDFEYEPVKKKNSFFSIFKRN